MATTESTVYMVVREDGETMLGSHKSMSEAWKLAELHTKTTGEITSVIEYKTVMTTRLIVTFTTAEHLK